MMQDVMRKSDKWIPWYFVAFFVVLAILDGIFVTIAFSTHTGVVTQNAYQKGLDYNKVIAASERQKENGWKSNISLEGSLLGFELNDVNGHAIENAKVTAYMVRATQAGHDFLHRLPYGSNGRYEDHIIFPLKGQWDITVVAEWKNETYQQTQRVVVK
jgi:nitrogen fixation protein FixH